MKKWKYTSEGWKLAKIIARDCKNYYILAFSKRQKACDWVKRGPFTVPPRHIDPEQRDNLYRANRRPKGH